MHAVCCGVMVQWRRWGRDSVCAGVHNTCCGGDCRGELHADVHSWPSLRQRYEHVCGVLRECVVRRRLEPAGCVYCAKHVARGQRKRGSVCVRNRLLRKCDEWALHAMHKRFLVCKRNADSVRRRKHGHACAGERKHGMQVCTRFSLGCSRRVCSVSRRRVLRRRLASGCVCRKLERACRQLAELALRVQ